MTLPATLALASLAALLAIWLGYPLLIWAAARIFPARLYEGAVDRNRTVSVILATREHAAVVRQRIDNLLSTDHPAHLLQVVVALDSQGAQCSAHELDGVDHRVVVVTGDAPGGKAAALNAGVRRATGDILVLADAAQRFDARTIPELVAALSDPRFGAVSGALELGGHEYRRRSPVDFYWAMEKWLRHNEARVHSSVGVTGAVYATRRALWPVVPASTLLDDVYVPMSLVLAGHRVGFTYAARAFDVRTFDSSNEGVRKTRTLTGVMQLRVLLPDILSWRRNPICAQFVAHKLLRLLTPLLAAIFALSIAVLAVQVTLRASSTQRLVVLRVIAALFVLPATRRRILALVRWGVSLQMATTRALVNGVSGRWSVWSKTRS
ncbi:MAG: glycosyltransferase [Phycisphaerae bacterium]|nr:glycosyltransferase [Gemmatimonadaceae bacterium]